MRIANLTPEEQAEYKAAREACGRADHALRTIELGLRNKYLTELSLYPAGWDYEINDGQFVVYTRRLRS